LHLITGPGAEIDILENEHCWLPVYLPAFEPGLKVQPGDRILASCTTAPGENGHNPDYSISGAVHFGDGTQISFSVQSRHASQTYGGTALHRRLLMEGADELQSGTIRLTGERAAGLRQELRQRLPEYMVPSAFVQMREFPLTPNGKLDRKALPAPEALEEEQRRKHVLPRTAVEEILCGIWAGVLGLPQVGIHDNFFELGGHSLLATQIISRTERVLAVELGLRRLFEIPTIAQLAAAIEEAHKTSGRSIIPPLQKKLHSGKAPLSFAQQRLWFMEQFEPGGTAYLIPAAVRLKGCLDPEALRNALREVTERHEVLRTRILMVEGEPTQLIGDGGEQRLEVSDLRGLSPEDREIKIRQLGEFEAATPFDLAIGPLLRARLVKLQEDEHVLFLTMHHIVSDGWSMGILVSEIGTIYEAFTSKKSPLPKLKIQYADYAIWQREWLQGTALENQIAYWRQQLAGVPVLELPTDHPRPRLMSWKGSSTSIHLREELVGCLEELGRREGVTLFMALLAAFQLVLRRWSGQVDIAVGTPVANRPRPELEELIGFFANQLVLRVNSGGEMTSRDLLARVREACLGAYAHQDLPFERLVEELNPERDLSRTPLFQVMIVMQTAPAASMRLERLRLEQIPLATNTAKFDLTLSLNRSENGCQAVLEYASELYERTTAERMLDHWQRALDQIAANHERPISAIEIMSERERLQVQIEWNNTWAAPPDRRCVHHGFEAQVEKTPNAPAVAYQDSVLSYAELNRRANQLAHYLRELGVNPEIRVGLCVERSLEMIVGMLGILKAGGTYVPIEPDYPAARIAFMLEDSQAGILLSQEKLQGRLPENLRQVIYLDSDWPAIAERNGNNPAADVDPENAAYIIYTSGSTGRPKGVMALHRAVCNVAEAQIKAFDVREGVSVLQFVSFAYDAAVSDWTCALFTGGKLVLVQAGIVGGQDLHAVLLESEVEMAAIPPAVLALISDEQLPRLRTLVTGGEKCSPQVVAQWATGRAMLNAYGPTECTITSAIAPLHPGEAITIGQPVGNTQIYVLGKDMELAPIGVPGELYIGGAGLARGYVNQPGLTAERFIPNLFGGPGSRLYRSGDIGRWCTDGTLEFLGRTDAQVKIRGYRIELGEIETLLCDHPGVREAVVMPIEEQPGEKQLAAYFVSRHDSPAVAELREHLKQRLPGYMIPAVFVRMEKMPLNAHGKIDQNALPRPEGSRQDPQRVYIAPRTELEKTITEIWARFLGLGQVGVEDNFFELGGHSLLAIQVMSQVRQVFEVDLPLRRLFDVLTVAGLAEAVQEAQLRQQDEMAALLVEVDSMKPEEVKALLSKYQSAESHS